MEPKIPWKLGGRWERELGLVLEGNDGKVARMSLTIGPEHINGAGVAHGAVIFGLADTASGYLILPQLPPDRAVVGAQMSIQFLAPGAVGMKLLCEAELLRLGKRSAAAIMRVTDPAGTLVAVVTGTFAIIARPTGPEQKT